MATNRTILVDIDPTAEVHPALEKSIWLAKHYEATLELFICDYDPFFADVDASNPPGFEKARENLMQTRRDQLSALATKAQEAGVTATIDVAWDHPIDEAIIRNAENSQPIMVVKDTHYHPIFKRTIFTNTDWNLIRNCPTNLLLVKPREISKSVKVLAAVDPVHEHDKPADLDRRILFAATELANRCYGELSVFHSFDPAPAIATTSAATGMPVAVPVADIVAAYETRHRAALDDLTEYRSVPSDRVHLIQGSASQLLPQFVEQHHTDIVVMGAVSKRGIKSAFVGHTAERVLDRLSCDLLIVKPEGFAAH